MLQWAIPHFNGYLAATVVRSSVVASNCSSKSLLLVLIFLFFASPSIPATKAQNVLIINLETMRKDSKWKEKHMQIIILCSSHHKAQGLKKKKMRKVRFVLGKERKQLKAKSLLISAQKVLF